MPHTIGWYIPDEIYYVHFSGTTTVEELEEFLEEATGYIENSPREIVHSILDVGDVVESAPVLDTLKVFRGFHPHRRAGWTLTIREKSTLIKMGSALGASLINTRFRAFATLDEALRFLKSVDQTLSWDRVEEKFAKPTAG